jgi:hypothetical protein
VEGVVTLSAPEPLNASHQISIFDCDIPELNEWLRKRAFANNKEGASRTYVITDAQRVVGYYALAAGAINITAAPGRFRRNMPTQFRSPYSADWRLLQRIKERGSGAPYSETEPCGSSMRPISWASGA